MSPRRYQGNDLYDALNRVVTLSSKSSYQGMIEHKGNTRARVLEPLGTEKNSWYEKWKNEKFARSGK